MIRFLVMVAVFLALPGDSWALESTRRVRSLDGAWEFRREGAADVAWKSVTIPSAMQEHEGNDWHGIGWYRKRLDAIDLPANRRLILHFDAAATHAEVWWDETRLGEHLGGWTPFRFDVTDLMRKHGTGAHTIRVRLDERVGHNSQGFLPIVQPHFGGLWQSIRLIETPDRDIDETQLFAIGDPKTGIVTVEAPTTGKGGAIAIDRVHYRLVGAPDWQSADSRQINTDGPIGIFRHQLKIPGFKRWSPAEPNLYEIEFTGAKCRFAVRAAFRSIETQDDQLLLNGQPLVIRGVLNWGYYPPRLAPMPDRARWKRDIELVKQMGFNCMKFCLWLPPREFFDLCDEMGMLVWQEYPTWHPKLDQKHRAELVREFTEFFQYDRNHPSVILRSLTCETGSGADVTVIRELYNLAKMLIPGCVVEDDSSWIEWNRISDFFDDHPYGNNHTWVKTLHRLRDYAERKGPKPLVLGEAIGADTWIDPAPLLKRVGGERPYWLPGFLDGNARWLERMRSLYGPGGLDRLEADSRHYAMLMRRFQIETYRREMPNGGYVVSVLRDFPLAGMGLIGVDDQPKWSAGEWSWHGESPSWMLTANDRRSYRGGGYRLGATIGDGDKVSGRDDELPKVRKPKREEIQCGLSVWPIWIVPSPDIEPDGILRATRLTADLLTKLESGARVILFPDGERGSFPLRDHWFLRGGPYLPDHPLWQRVPRELIVELQHFDLAGRVIPDIGYLDEIDPVILLWDNHDIKEMNTHALVFETRVGRGRLLVSALNHHGFTNAAGQWLRVELEKHLANGPPPRRALRPETIGRMREKLGEQKLDLTKRDWRFKPDPANAGMRKGWEKPDHKLDDSWRTIRVGKHWEAQGWPNLDGWAWYRLDVEIPRNWAGQPIYLLFEGVDDHYQAFVNGTLIGTGGDPGKKLTAFEERASHEISKAVKPGDRCTIAIRVLDWYGAGGIHRPVTLGTARLGGADLLR